MEASEKDLILKVIKTNVQLKRLYEEHETLEEKLRGYEKRNFLTPHEVIEQKRLKKQKLLGVDRMMQILNGNQAAHSAA